MNEAIERASKAIWTLRNSTSEQQARAAIKSLREPCPHAVAAAASKLGLDPYKIAGAWITMVDTMLERETQA